MLVDMAKNISQDMSMPCVIDYVVDAARNLLEAMRVSVYFKVHTFHLRGCRRLTCHVV